MSQRLEINRNEKYRASVSSFRHGPPFLMQFFNITLYHAAAKLRSLHYHSLSQNKMFELPNFFRLLCYTIVQSMPYHSVTFQ